MPITKTLDLFVYEIGHIYDAEHRFLESQWEMAQKATDQDLEKAIRGHIEQTRLHIRNLEEIFDLLDQQPRRQTSHVAQWLVNEAQQTIQQVQDEALRDCAINASVIKVEHFEVGSYRSMFTGAQLMGQTEMAELLDQNMRQEEETARIAERSAGELLRKARQAEKPEEEGLMDKVKGIKDRLTGQ
jgi:ferritin-like metal-binding protein YciE